MKKIFAILALVLVLTSAVFAVDTIDVENTAALAVDSDVTISVDDKEDALAQDSAPLCLRYLKNKYPDAGIRRLESICIELKQRPVAAATIKEKVAVRVEKMTQLNSSQKDIIARLARERQEKLANLENEKLQKVAALSKENIEKLSLLNRARIEKISGKSNDEIKKALEKVRIQRYANKADMFRLRTVQNYQAAKERYELLKQKHFDIKDEVGDERDAFRQAVESGDDEAAFEAGKEYLLSVADLVLNNLEKLKANVEANDDLSDEDAEEILAEIDANIQLVTEAKADVEAAETKEELKEAGALIIRDWNRIKAKVRFNSGLLIKSKVMDTLRRAEFLGNKLERALARLEDAGYEIEDADELMAEYTASLDDAKEYFSMAKEKFDEARDLLKTDGPDREDIEDLVSEGQEYLKSAHESLKEAHAVSVEIIAEIRATGQLDDVLEDNPEDFYLVEEEEENTGESDAVECETDSDCSEVQTCADGTIYYTKGCNDGVCEEMVFAEGPCVNLDTAVGIAG